MNRITIMCFGASYAVALVAEMVQLIWPRPVQRYVALGFASAGLVAHTIFLLVQPLALASEFWSVIFLAWILAVFYLYGSFHHGRLTWGVFVLPIVVGLTALAATMQRPEISSTTPQTSIQGERWWVAAHICLLLLAAVGICVGFVSSLMYLIQARRLRAKELPGKRLRLLSLERLETMNRRAIMLSFPLLTAGLLIGSALLLQRPEQFQGWADPKVWGTAALWLVFAILLYLRYGIQARGRRVAFLTIMAFALLIFTLAASHPVVQGGGR